MCDVGTEGVTSALAPWLAIVARSIFDTNLRRRQFGLEIQGTRRHSPAQRMRLASTPASPIRTLTARDELAVQEAFDPELAAAVAAWPSLLSADKAGMLATLNCAVPFRSTPATSVVALCWAVIPAASQKSGIDGQAS